MSKKTVSVKIFKAFGVGDDLMVLDNENRLWVYKKDSQEWFRIASPEIEIDSEDYDEEEHA